MEKASQLATLHPPEKIPVAGGSATLTLALPRQAVSLLVLQW